MPADQYAEYKEQQEVHADSQQLASSIQMQEEQLTGEDAKFKRWMNEHQKTDSTHDQFYSPLVRLSNLDAPANKRLRFYYMLLFKCADFGPRAARFTKYLWDVIRAETDIYAATGPGRERVMLTTNRNELVRQSQDAARPGGFGSLVDMVRGNRR